MIKTVIKRDGTSQPFQYDKIINAISKAFKACELEEFPNKYVKNRIKKYLLDLPEEVSVEDIQDAVENCLMKGFPNEVAKNYILWRDKRASMREKKTKGVFKGIISVENNDVTRENANMNSDSPAGMMMKFASESTKPFVDSELLSVEVKEAIKNNYLHIHDKDYYPTRSLTCLQHPLDRILSKGFKAGHGESRGAKRIETASILAAISMETIQNEMHGGQAIPAFDFYMAPYVKLTFEEELKKACELLGCDIPNHSPIKEYVKTDLSIWETPEERLVYAAVNATVNRVHQSMESFIHNMNSIHSRGGNQVVFSSINYGTDTSAEGRCVIRELLLSTERGVGNGSTAIFPIQIFKRKIGVNANPEDPNYDLYKLSCKVTAKRFFPNFINLDAPFNQHEKWNASDPERYKWECATMGCRTRVFDNRFGEKTSIGRGNLSFTTINLVKLALESNHNLTTFYNLVEQYSKLAAIQLHERFIFQSQALAKQFPLLMKGMWNGSESLNSEDTIKSVINQGTLGIGFIGLAEALIALTGKHHAESEESQFIGLKTVHIIKEVADSYSELLQHNYSVLATPAEGLSGKFTKKDKETYGIIKGVTDKEYYTNSNHVPVYYKCSAEHKIKIEAPYHELTLGGHIWYLEVDGDTTNNPEAIMDIVNKACNSNIGYISINHFRSRCNNCNYETTDKDIKMCPKCGEELDTLQRITGYLVGSTNRWNAAKLAELNDRVQHVV